MRRNPLRIIGGRGSNSGSTVRSISRLGLLRASGLLRVTTPAPALLWEVRRNPNRVEEVDNAREESQDKEVEENTVRELVLANTQVRAYRWGSNLTFGGQRC